MTSDTERILLYVAWKDLVNIIYTSKYEVNLTCKINLISSQYHNDFSLGLRWPCADFDPIILAQWARPIEVDKWIITFASLDLVVTNIKDSGYGVLPEWPW